MAVVTMGLTLAFAGGVPAQSPPRVASSDAAAWTGAWVFDQGPVTDGTTTTTATYKQTIALVVSGTVEADDPRMAGSMLQVMDVRSAIGPDAGEVLFARGRVRLDNEDGMWVGTMSGFGGGIPDPDTGLSIHGAWYVLEGGGYYEGLSAVFRWHSDDSSFEGVILPAALSSRLPPTDTPAG
jgi:hypothetical protein